MDGLTHDVRYALRAVRRAPAFSAVAIVCLAVGIGVNAAAFSVFDALLVRDLPGVERQEELNAVLVSHDRTRGRTSPKQLSTLEWDIFRGAIPAFSHSAVMGFGSVALRVSGAPLAVRADFVSGTFFDMLRTRPVLGRLLSEADDAPGAAPVIVLGYDFWSNEFGASLDVLGKPLYIGNVAFSVVGVAPKGFVGLYPGELIADPEFGAPYVYIPLAGAPLVRATSHYATTEVNLDDEWLQLFGRRRPGASTDDVEAQAQLIAARVAAAYPRYRANAVAVLRAPSTATTVETIAAFGFVMAIPLIILLVACANLANQLLARAVQRGREIAVRLSLGATRARIVRLLLVESTLLAIAASVGGIVLARLLTDALLAFALVIPFRIPIDARVMLFTIALALVTAVAFGLVPALRATRLDLAQAMKDGANMGGGYRRSRLRDGLVVLQVASSVALLALTGVFARAADRSRVLDMNANADRLLTVSLDLDLLGYTVPAGRAFQALAMERLRALPGVEAVALAPLRPVGSLPEERVLVAGDDPERFRSHDVARVAGDWFATRNTRTLAGRLFTPTEARGAPSVAVVDEWAARRLWRDQNAIGQILRIGAGDSADVVTVIGVIPTVPDHPVEDPEGLIIVPAGDRYDARARFYVRTRGDAAALRTTVRNAIQTLDTRLPVASVATLGESMDASAGDVAQMASGVGVMGTIALLLAALGLSAVLSFVVAQRRYEIGVRIALGAQSSAVTWMILRQSLALCAFGVVAGALLAAAVATLLRNILFGVPPIDPVAFAGSTAVILVVALVSSLKPARRAARIDPMMALRAE